MKILIEATKMKWIISAIAVMIIAKIAYFFLDDRPFKFEDFNDSKQLEKALKEKIPLGSNAEEVINTIQQSGAICETIQWKVALPNNIREYKTAYRCEYSTPWFSLHRLATYRAWIISDKNNRLAYVGAEKTNGWII